MHSLTVYIILLFPNLSIKTGQLKSICKIERIPVDSVYFRRSGGGYDNLSRKLFEIRNNIPIRIKGQYINVLCFLKGDTAV